VVFLFYFMKNKEYVITGIGVVAPTGIGKNEFWESCESGKNGISVIEGFSVKKIPLDIAGEVKDFNAENLLGPKGLRNLDRSALFLLGAAKLLLNDAKLEITENNADDIGVSTGTTFSHLLPIAGFDREVFKEGMDFTNPALFPSTVINAASSQVSIRFNIQGFNATISTGYTSSMEAMIYGLHALENGHVSTVLAGSVDTLSYPLLFGFHKLGYLAGIQGPAISCPFDKRRNGPILGEAAAMISMESLQSAKKRNALPYAKIRSITRYFDARGIAKIHPQGNGLEIAVRRAIAEAGIAAEDIDYISSCANSTQDMDRIETAVLKKVFGNALGGIPVSSIKSMIGETCSVSGALQIISVIGAMHHGVIPPTINYKEKDAGCDIDCVPNNSRKKQVKLALITSFGPGGYNSACILERI
jgi:3-oxoacyl-[acyl-carrier-protein] synthase II